MHKGWKEENSMGIADRLLHTGVRKLRQPSSLYIGFYDYWSQDEMKVFYCKVSSLRRCITFPSSFLLSFTPSMIRNWALFYVGICSIWLPTLAADFVSHAPERRTFHSTAAYGRGISWNCSVFSTFMILLCHQPPSRLYWLILLNGT